MSIYLTPIYSSQSLHNDNYYDVIFNDINIILMTITMNPSFLLIHNND